MQGSRLLCLEILIVIVTLNTRRCAAQISKISVLDTIAGTNRQKLASYVTPSIFVLYGVFAPNFNISSRLDKNTNAELREDHPGFAFPLDNYLRYAPAFVVYGVDALGFKAKHDMIDRSIMLLIAGAITSTGVTLSKNNINRLRPGGGIHSFPSSHTATAFMTAEFMHQEFKDDYPLVSFLGYVTATATGVLRLYNGAHWVSDVAAGAGYGILATKISYLLYPAVKQLVFHKKSIHLVVLPVRDPSYMGIVLIHSFN